MFENLQGATLPGSLKSNCKSGLCFYRAPRCPFQISGCAPSLIKTSQICSWNHLKTSLCQMMLGKHIWIIQFGLDHQPLHWLVSRFCNSMIDNRHGMIPQNLGKTWPMSSVRVCKNAVVELTTPSWLMFRSANKLNPRRTCLTSIIIDIKEKVAQYTERSTSTAIL